jgi:hypothetical protein
VSSNFFVEVAEGCSVAGVGGNHWYLGCKRAYAIVLASWIAYRFRSIFGSFQIFVRDMLF